jgi:hypothetical protein
MQMPRPTHPTSLAVALAAAALALPAVGTATTHPLHHTRSHTVPVGARSAPFGAVIVSHRIVHHGPDR